MCRSPRVSVNNSLEVLQKRGMFLYTSRTTMYKSTLRVRPRYNLTGESSGVLSRRVMRLYLRRTGGIRDKHHVSHRGLRPICHDDEGPRRQLWIVSKVEVSGPAQSQRASDHAILCPRIDSLQLQLQCSNYHILLFNSVDRSRGFHIASRTAEPSGDNVHQSFGIAGS